MTAGSLPLPGMFSARNLASLAGPVLIILVMAMMVLPLPPVLLDVFFTFNIALAILVLLMSLYTAHPLEFAAFPTVLLMTTLLRLSLNVASTRVVLLEGHAGADAAGKVIEAFGHFLVGGNYAVGLVVFSILVVINFVVITKGAGRIAEVSARFTLDAMPGKQMAIDADLNAGLIGEEEARRRRAEIAREADFYGSMDGASKFVRGDAVAGIVVMLINIVGGLCVGVIQHDLDFATAARNYTLLTIGDGLVAQIPALIISTAAGVVVSRVGTGEDVGHQLVSQLFGNAQAVALTGGIIGILGLVPGMPHFAFLATAAALAGASWVIARRQARAAAPPSSPAAEPEAAREDATWEDVQLVDVLGLEVGYRLIPLVDKGQDGDLLRRIRALRRKFAQDIGFLPPAVHIRDNLELKPGGYRILLKGVEIGRGEVTVNQLLAINPGRVLGQLPGAAATDPAFGLPAVWIEPGLRDQAQSFGYTVADAGTVVATHLNHLVYTHAAELLGRQEVQSLLERVAREAPKLVEDLVPKVLPLSALQKTLASLLEEGVHIRDMRTIIETLAEHGPRVQDAAELTALARVALGRGILHQIAPGPAEVPVLALAPELERLLLSSVGSGPDAVALEPGLVDTLSREAGAACARQESLGLQPVLLTSPALRPLLSRVLRRTTPQLKVIAHTEVPDARRIRVVAMLGGKG